jgi:hypothetical protein
MPLVIVNPGSRLEHSDNCQYGDFLAVANSSKGPVKDNLFS